MGRKIKEFEYEAKETTPPDAFSNTTVPEADQIQNQYTAFLESIRAEAMESGSIRIFVSGKNKNRVPPMYSDAFSGKKRGSLTSSVGNDKIFSRRIKSNPDKQGRKIIEYWLSKDRGQEIGTVWGEGKAIIKADIILQTDAGKNLADPNSSVKVMVRASIINWGSNHSSVKGRKRGTLVLTYDQEEKTLKHNNKVFESSNTREISEEIHKFLTDQGGE
jgi:hypothetical protein